MESIPDGFEIYENPNARVFLRRIQPKVFTDEEISIVENGVKKYSAVKRFTVDVRKNSIIVFLADRDPDEFKAIFSKIVFFPDSPKLKKIYEECLYYSPMMRFVLVDRESREFEVERWCFLGSIDDWITIDGSNDLAGLVKKYCKHLGKESFYELI